MYSFLSVPSLIFQIKFQFTYRSDISQQAQLAFGKLAAAMARMAAWPAVRARGASVLASPSLPGRAESARGLRFGMERCRHHGQRKRLDAELNSARSVDVCRQLKHKLNSFAACRSTFQQCKNAKRRIDDPIKEPLRTTGYGKIRGYAYLATVVKQHLLA